MINSLNSDISNPQSHAKLKDYGRNDHLGLGLATSIFLNSIDVGTNKGMTITELNLASYSEQMNFNDIEIMVESLVKGCHFIHKVIDEKEPTKYLFLENPNLESLIKSTEDIISTEQISDYLSSILKKIKGNSRVNIYTGILDSSEIQDETSFYLDMKKSHLNVIIPNFSMSVTSENEEKIINFSEYFIKFKHAKESEKKDRIYKKSMFVLLPDQEDYLNLYQKTRRLISLNIIKEKNYNQLTISDRMLLDNYIKEITENLPDQLIITLSHIYHLEKDQKIVHTRINRDYLVSDKLADRIYTYLSQKDIEIINESFSPRRITDISHAFWHKSPNNNPVPIMSLKEIWLISCKESRADRFANKKVLWDTINKGYELQLFILGYQTDNKLVEELKFEKIFDNSISDNTTFENYYLIRNGVEYKVKCPNCENYTNKIINGRCENCKLIECQRCHSISDIRFIDETGCPDCKGKEQCPNCNNLVFPDQIKVINKVRKCSYCLDKVQCPRCKIFVKEDNLFEEFCVNCKDLEFCSNCHNLKPKASLIEGKCNDCRNQKLKFLCQKCGKFYPKEQMASTDICKNCDNIEIVPAKEEKNLKGSLNVFENSEFTNLIRYYLNLIVSNRNAKEMEIQFDLNIKLKKPK